MTLERTIEMRSQADRLLVAQLNGEAKHHARWRELTQAEAEVVAAVAGLRELAAGLCRQVGAAPEAIRGWIEERPAAEGRREDAARIGRRARDGVRRRRDAARRIWRLRNAR